MGSLRAVVLSLALLATGCSTTALVIPNTAPLAAPEVVQLELGGLYDVTLIRGPKPLLVDAGPEAAFEDLCAGLRKLGVEPKDLGLLILTHAHSDHAGGARALQELGVPVLVHEGDAGWLRAGDHGELFATNLEAVLAQPTIPSRYPAVEPDIVLHGEAPYPLDAFGLDGTLVHVGGHTPGSIVVHLGNGAVILGDLVRGGWLAGLVDRGAPARHLFHQYPVEDSIAIAEGFVRRVAACHDVKLAYVGHGGPVTAEALRDWAGDMLGPCPW